MPPPDALDERPEAIQTRSTLLGGLKRLGSKPSYLEIFSSSRGQDDLQAALGALQAKLILMSSRNIGPVTRKHVVLQLSSDRRLDRSNATMKERIVEVVSIKADGMFRWVCCQINIPKGLKSAEPK